MEDYKIKTSSIVSYGLGPLVSLNGKESLVNIWSHANKQEVIDQTSRDLLKEYVEFCVIQINKLVMAFKLNMSNNWDRHKPDSYLTTTSVNGFLVCLREFVNSGNLHEVDYYKEKLNEIAEFKFKDYKSSHWKKLGTDIYENYF